MQWPGDTTIPLWALKLHRLQRLGYRQSKVGCTWEGAGWSSLEPLRQPAIVALRRASYSLNQSPPAPLRTATSLTTYQVTATSTHGDPASFTECLQSPPTLMNKEICESLPLCGHQLYCPQCGLPYMLATPPVTGTRQTQFNSRGQSPPGTGLAV